MFMGWRTSKEYRQWRISVIRRDVVCQVCGSRTKRHAHHLNHATYFPDERFDADNGICLCGDCHMNFHNNYKRSYREKCTKYDWDNFKSLIKYFRGIAKTLVGGL